VRPGRPSPSLSRRALLGLAGASLASGLAPRRARAQAAPAPRRGGTLTIRTIRACDPPHFDPYLTLNYKTHVVYSFTHSPVAIVIHVRDGALRNYGPNLGHDYGGRLQAAWLGR
jgi:hypothetical protein